MSRRTASYAAVLAAVMAVSLIHAAPADDMASRFRARVYRSKTYSSLPYRLLVPRGYTSSRKYPLVLFLHGVGERGADNTKQLHAGLNIFADEKKMDRHPCFIAAPQCPADSWWVDADHEADRHVMSDRPTAALAMSLELVDSLSNEFSIDTGRIYVVGYSMGGFGAWEAIQRRPDLFAAAVPACGGGDETLARRIRRVPIWAFHGAHDPIVNIARSRNMIHALIAAGGVPRYTEYAEVNHFCWGLAFGDSDMHEWLFSRKK